LDWNSLSDEFYVKYSNDIISTKLWWDNSFIYIYIYIYKATTNFNPISYVHTYMFYECAVRISRHHEDLTVDITRGCSSTLSAWTSFPFCSIDRGRIYALLRYKIFLRFGTRCRFQDIINCLSIERDIKMKRECETEREDSNTLNAFELAFL